MAVDKSPQRVREMFAQIARKYDFLNHLLSLNIDRSWRRKTVRIVQPSGSAPILDVCTGTGDLALEYAKALNGQGQVIGADFCRPMLEIGRDKALSEKANIAFVEADTEHLPFDNDKFQIVSVAFGLRNVRDTEQGLREMKRVCAPGGSVAVLEFSKPWFPPFRWIYDAYFRWILPGVGQWFSRNKSEAYRYLPESVGEFPSGEALAEKMRSCGLHDVQWKPFTFGVATLYWGRK